MTKTERMKDLPRQETPDDAVTPAERMPRLGELFGSFLRFASVSFGILISPERSPMVKFQQRYVMSHRNFANCRCVKAFWQFCSSQKGCRFSQSVLGA